MDIFGGRLSCLVASSEIPPATLALLYLMNLGAQEVSGGGHLPKGGGNVIQALLHEVGPVDLEIGLPGYLHYLRFFGEGFSVEVF